MIPVFVAVGTAAGASAAAAAVVGGLIVSGTAMSIVGAVTGNKDLSRFGAVLSLAGGIGGLASGAWGSAASSVAASSSAASGAVDTSALTLANAAAPSATSFGAASYDFGTGVSGISMAAPAASSADGLILANSAPAAPTAAAVTAAPTTPIASSAPATSYPTPGTAADAGTSSVANLGSATPATPAVAPGSDLGGAVVSPASGQPAVPDFSGMNPSGGAMPATTSATTPAGFGQAGGVNFDPTVQAGNNFWGTVGDTVKGVGKWLNDNPGMAKVAGGLVQGAATSYGAQLNQQRQYDLQQQAIAAQRARYTASLQGVQAPVYQAPPKGP